MSRFRDKIRSVGGVDFISQIAAEELKAQRVQTLQVVQDTMGVLPQADVIDFITDFGNSYFKKNVFGKTANTSSFLNTEDIDIGTVYGWPDTHTGIREIINTYNIEEQLNTRFFPLFEGYPGDVIYYSLNQDTFGKIFYWHHEGELDAPDTLISNSFSDFIDTLFIGEEDEETDEEPLSDDELTRINANRNKAGFPPIDKYRNIIA
ncbi:hypothetical protein D0C36_12665 [Mucilaginibacter conchicola]|uniref:Knr4/Smi1-like domain-containing protein n=1 Tax=Mucilaginibacter conchicola TaxID=2303333 RepID=A0A372NTH0_9SPHI|nr:SMI1/KNR4 family protein [Mucilaginibacter conchicola]RFZ92284.1 hypothetical protein D0C36_12665 [Mucilaginibacter conchicola]